MQFLLVWFGFIHSQTQQNSRFCYVPLALVYRRCFDRLVATTMGNENPIQFCILYPRQAFYLPPRQEGDSPVVGGFEGEKRDPALWPPPLSSTSSVAPGQKKQIVPFDFSQHLHSRVCAALSRIVSERTFEFRN